MWFESDVWCARVGANQCRCFGKSGMLHLVGFIFNFSFLFILFLFHQIEPKFLQCVCCLAVRTQYRANCHKPERVCAKIKSKLAEIKWMCVGIFGMISHWWLTEWLVLCCALQCLVLVCRSISIAHPTKWNCQLLHIHGSVRRLIGSTQIRLIFQFNTFSNCCWLISIYFHSYCNETRALWRYQMIHSTGHRRHRKSN